MAFAHALLAGLFHPLVTEPPPVRLEICVP